MKKLILLLLLATPVLADDEDDGPHLIDGPPTQPTIEIVIEPDGDMSARPVKVPEITAGIPIICHRDTKPGTRQMTCLYMNKETGQAILKNVLTNEESV
jgi:hypothetical protein